MVCTGRNIFRDGHFQWILFLDGLILLYECTLVVKYSYKIQTGRKFCDGYIVCIVGCFYELAYGVVDFDGYVGDAGYKDIACGGVGDYGYGST